MGGGRHVSTGLEYYVACVFLCVCVGGGAYLQHKEGWGSDWGSTGRVYFPRAFYTWQAKGVEPGGRVIALCDTSPHPPRSAWSSAFVLELPLNHNGNIPPSLTPGFKTRIMLTGEWFNASFPAFTLGCVAKHSVTFNLFHGLMKMPLNNMCTYAIAGHVL